MVKQPISNFWTKSPALTKTKPNVEAVSKLARRINRFLSPELVLHDQLSLHKFADFASKTRTAYNLRLAGNPHQNPLTSVCFMELLQIEVKCLVWLELFEDVFDIIKSHMAFLLVPDMQKLELCLIGAICLCLLGRFEESRSLAKDVLSILKAEAAWEPVKTTLQCTTLRLLGYLALHGGDLAESLALFKQTFSLDMCMAARTSHACTNLLKDLLFFVQWQESVQVVAFLEFFLWRGKEEDAHQGVIFKSHYELRDTTSALREIYLERVYMTSPRKCRLVARLGRLYRLGHSLLESRKVAKSKECFKEWLHVWTMMCGEETLAIGTTPPWLLGGQVVLTIGVHVLQILGRICEEEENFDQARWCYLRVASLHDCLYLKSHRSRTKNHQDVERVEYLLQTSH